MVHFHQELLTVGGGLITVGGGLVLLWLKFGSNVVRKADCERSRETCLSQVNEKLDSVITTLHGTDMAGGIVKIVTETAVIVKSIARNNGIDSGD